MLENILWYLLITRPSWNEGTDGECMYLSVGIYRWSEIAKVVCTSLKRILESISGIFWWSRRLSVIRGSPGESSYENLESDLVKSFNPNRREIRVPEYRRGVKDPNTTPWRHGAVSRTSMLVKVFERLDSTSAKEFGRGIPTGSRL